MLALALHFGWCCFILRLETVVASIKGNEKGAVCSTGWITHWGESMANTSAVQLAEAMSRLLQYGNGTGSVNLYVAHGGSNWGFSAGTSSL